MCLFLIFAIISIKTLTSAQSQLGNNLEWSYYNHYWNYYNNYLSYYNHYYTPQLQKNLYFHNGHYEYRHDLHNDVDEATEGQQSLSNHLVSPNSNSVNEPVPSYSNDFHPYANWSLYQKNNCIICILLYPNIAPRDQSVTHVDEKYLSNNIKRATSTPTGHNHDQYLFFRPLTTTYADYKNELKNAHNRNNNEYYKYTIDDSSDKKSSEENFLPADEYKTEMGSRTWNLADKLSTTKNIESSSENDDEKVRSDDASNEIKRLSLVEKLLALSNLFQQNSGSIVELDEISIHIPKNVAKAPE